MGTLLTYKQAIKRRRALPLTWKVVLATGVFDILHSEHLRFLKAAKAEADALFVGIESDRRVRELKGKGRPVNPEDKRAADIAALQPVDIAFILPTNLRTKEGRERFIKTLKPHLYALSANTPFLADKRHIMEKFGGEVRVVLEHNPAISTTKLIAVKRKHFKRNR